MEIAYHLVANATHDRPGAIFENIRGADRHGLEYDQPSQIPFEHQSRRLHRREHQYY